MNRVQICFLVAVSIQVVLSSRVGRADETGETTRSLSEGEYRITSIEAPHGGETMLNAPNWERVEVVRNEKNWRLVIHYQEESCARTFDLRPLEPASPTIWYADSFSVNSSALLNGEVRLRMLFCYRGAVYLKLHPKNDMPVTQ